MNEVDGKKVKDAAALHTCLHGYVME